MEYFQIFDEAGAPLGLKRRDEVHRDGDWHKSAQVFLFNPVGELLLQKRARDKDLYADLWDYSVGEHLRPDEAAICGALRGLREELGVSSLVAADLLKLGERHVVLEGRGFRDREMQCAYRATYDGVITPDSLEVAEVRWMDMATLHRWLDVWPSEFTPWFREQVASYGFLPEKCPHKR